MRIRAAEWFETTISYEKRTEDGATELVKETYAVDALNFADSENSITEEVAPFVSGEFSAKTIKKAAYKEVLFTDNPKHDRWYKARVQFITIDEKSGKEKPTNITFLVQSYTLQNAVKNIEEIMSQSIQNWKLASIAETAILDVFEHKAKAEEATD